KLYRIFFASLTTLKKFVSFKLSTSYFLFHKIRI
ncbi:CLUMA_CG010071, isoform A, partial [Clunio marinus]